MIRSGWLVTKATDSAKAIRVMKETAAARTTKQHDQGDICDRDDTGNQGKESKESRQNDQVKKDDQGDQGADAVPETYEKARLAHTIIKKKVMENSVYASFFFIYYFSLF